LGSFRKHPTSAQPPRLLLLHEDPALIDLVAGILKPNISSLAIETCSSPRQVQKLLFNSPCHAIIASPTLNLVDGVSVLTCSQRLQPSVPLLMTVAAEEREVAKSWLDLGVYDFIFSPIDPGQVLESVQQALVLSKRRTMVVRKEQTLGYLRQRQERYQTNTSETPLHNAVDKLLQKSILRIEESKESLERTTKLIEASLERLQRSCKENELHAQQRALTRVIADLARQAGPT